MKISRLLGILCISVISSILQAHATSIYVINEGVSAYGMVQTAINHLVNLGYVVSSGDTLIDYTSYEQVWGLRYNTDLTNLDKVAMGNYLISGGRIFLSGEQPGFRNNSLVSFVTSSGAGSITLSGVNATIPEQTFTVKGNAVNSPNIYSNLNFGSAGGAVNPSNGFMVTVSPGTGGAGSLVGWDFGDITGSPNARMLIGFDIEMFGNGQGWTENMATYLGANAVPIPATVLLFGSGLLGLIGAAKRKKH